MIIRQKINYDCDVLVVGAGPAGSALAAHLGLLNINTLLIDKSIFPRDKICGDSISPLAIKELNILGITNLEAFKESNEVKSANVYIEGQLMANMILPKIADIKYCSKIIRRIDLDYWILTKAKQANVKIFENCNFIKYYESSNAVVSTLIKDSKEIKITSKLIVGADGCNSRVRNILHGGKPNLEYRYLAIRAYFENINGSGSIGELYFSRNFFPGIQWVFPLSDTSANIGIGVVAKTIPKSTDKLHDLLSEELKSNNALKARIGDGVLVGKIRTWPLLMYNPQQTISSSRCILIGEAAGLINSLSGDGVQYALQSGRWASKTICNILTKDNFKDETFIEYESKVLKELGKDFAFSDILVQLSRNKKLHYPSFILLKRVLKKANDDKEFGKILGGVFGGTYPSHELITPNFIMKLFYHTLSDVTNRISLETCISIIKNPNENIHWVKKLGFKGYTLTKRIIT